MSETSPKLRAELEGIPTYKPGKPAAAGGQVAYKLSSNENPYPPLPGVMETVTAAASSFNRYPDMACTALMAELSERFAVPASHLATGTGSVGVAQQLLQATSGPGDEVIYAWRSFEAYPIITQISGATSVQVPLTPGDVHDLDAMADAITDRTRLIFVCNPNNPTGTVVRRAELERFLDRVPGDVLVVLDEAYREFIRDAEVPDGVEIYRERPNVCVLRTFSKAYGLAGPAGRLRHRPRAGGRGAAQDRGAVRGEPDRAGSGDRLAARRGRADRPGRLAGVRAQPCDGRAARPGLDGAGDPGQLRVAAAGGAHGAVRAGM
ncbi:histidinol-phosphate/aromatic aminotransferase/cobyric acid decarboxylase-like protein [Streptomyces calvus]